MAGWYLKPGPATRALGYFDMLNKIHHINLLVRDLDAAVARYGESFGIEEFHWGELPERGVRTARFRAGESWIVLVQPTDSSGAPGRHLAEHGEGLFLLSFGVAGLDDACQRISTTAPDFLQGEPRQGLEGWQVQDLNPDSFQGALIQLTEDASDSH